MRIPYKLRWCTVITVPYRITVNRTVHRRVTTLIIGHYSPTRAYFHPKTRGQHFLYNTKLSWVFKSRSGEDWFSSFLAPLLLIFLREMGQNGVSDQLLGRFTLFCCNDIYYHTNIILIGAVGGDIWRIGSEKWGSRRGQLDIIANPGSIEAQVLSATSGY